MTRRAEQIPLDDDWVLTKVWSKSRAAPAILAAIQAVPRDEAFIPALSAGPAFDSPEVVPLAGGSVGNAMPPNCDFGSYIAHAAHDAAEGPEGCDSTGCVIPQAVDEH